MHRVSICAAADYRPATIKKRLRQLLEPFGGIEAFVKPGERVLLKPNLLSGKPPELAVTTHPEIVRGVIELVQMAGATALVGDSPGIGRPEQVLKKCGIWKVIQETGAGFAPFTVSVNVATKTGTFQQLELAQDILDADVIINLPKLKTHQMMGMTCGVKNLFGAVVGMRKPRLHLQAGVSKEYFALMLLELAEFINPALTIVDAVVGMEGDGPGSGDPVEIGALLAGVNALAVDTVACELLGLAPDSVWTQVVAHKTKRPGARLDQIEIVGAPAATLRPAAFKPAHSSELDFRLPRFLKKTLRSTLSARPEVDHERCRRCGICVEACPPQIMTIENNRLQINDKACIRCFCCQELCPDGAILTRQGLLLRLSQFIGGGSRSS
ncbi:MAG: DUF362 domain-containing protein [Desulfuromonadales bacterium]|nr:DUF362 domain-containing protein [Desulfuromonadales bacterium]